MLTEKTNEFGYHKNIGIRHDVTLIKGSQTWTYVETRRVVNSIDSRVVRVVIVRDAYDFQSYASLQIWKDGWHEFHRQNITSLPAVSLHPYADESEIDVSLFEDSAYHLWVMARDYCPFS